VWAYVISTGGDGPGAVAGGAVCGWRPRCLWSRPTGEPAGVPERPL